MATNNAINLDSTRFVMSSSGERTMPLQPAFLVGMSATGTNVTGDGTAYVIPFGSEMFDVGNNFSGTTFTAPVTGKYMFVGLVTLDGLAAAHTLGVLEVVATGDTVTIGRIDVWAVSTPGADYTFSGSTVLSLTAADTVNLTVTVFNGTKTVEVWAAGSNLTRFAGYLIS